MQSGWRLTLQFAAGTCDPCVDREEMLSLPSQPALSSLVTQCRLFTSALQALRALLLCASASQGFPVSPEPPAVRSPVKLSGTLHTGACGYPPVRARNLMRCREDRPQNDRGHLHSQGSSSPQPSGVVAPQYFTAEASRLLLPRSSAGRAL